MKLMLMRNEYKVLNMQIDEPTPGSLLHFYEQRYLMTRRLNKQYQLPSNASYSCFFATTQSKTDCIRANLLEITRFELVCCSRFLMIIIFL